MGVKERLEHLIGAVKLIEISEFVNAMMQNKGITTFAHNQITIFPISKQLSEKIFLATEGYTDVDGKRFALEASKLYHEIRSHSDVEKEAARGQVIISDQDIFEVVEAMIDPDMIEDVSHGDLLDERNVFAVVKHTEKCVVVVLSVGGKRNPNVTPQQIIFFTKDRWADYQRAGMTVREILYGDSNKRKTDPELIEMIKKNRVTVAHRES